MLGLAACVKHPVQPPPAPPPAPEPVAEIPEDPVPLPDHKPVPPRPKPAPAPTPTEMAKLEPAPAVLLPPAPMVSAPSPIGLDQESVSGAYGAPASQTDAPPAIVWQYLAADCVLDVYFYRDVETGKTHALYVKLKGDDQSDDRLRTCLTRIAQRNAGNGTGGGTPVAR